MGSPAMPMLEMAQPPMPGCLIMEAQQLGQCTMIGRQEEALRCTLYIEHFTILIQVV